MSFQPRICLLGFGEVGQTLAADLLARGYSDIHAWDVQFTNAASAPSRAVGPVGVRSAKDAADAARSANVIISAVTAAQDLAAAESTAPHLQRDTWFMDVNSVSPGVKQSVCDLVTRAGARYIEAAVMSPIAPRRIGSPILLGGPHAHAFLPIAQSLGFSGAEVFAETLGRASAAKMCRSVMIKGMEALLTESLVSARHYGVEDTVIASLTNLFPGEDWAKVSRYMISRSLLHGRRRAEEMREVAQTVQEAGLTPSMSAAAAERQDWAAQFRDAADTEALTQLLDRLLPIQPQGRNSSC